MADNSDKHAYWANSVGAIAFFALLAFGMKCCNDKNVEENKTERIKIIYSKK